MPGPRPLLTHRRVVATLMVVASLVASALVVTPLGTDRASAQQPPTPQASDRGAPAQGPSMSAVPAVPAAGGSSSPLALDLTVSVTAIDFGPVVQGDLATGSFTIETTDPSVPSVELYWADPVTVVGYDCEGRASGTGFAEVGVSSAQPCTVDVEIDSAVLGLRTGTVEVYDPERAESLFVEVSAEVVAPPVQTNDAFVDAVDLSGLIIPAYVAGPDGQPEDTVSVNGTTFGSTREPGEYGEYLDNQGNPQSPGNGTVWFRFTAPAGGFEGRLGLRGSPGFDVVPLIADPGPPSAGNLRYSPGNTWPPSGLQFVRMEAGHTVWFQVSTRDTGGAGTPTYTEGSFTFELYQAPNEQDDIANAYDVSFGSPWPDPFNWGGDGDTFHLTPDTGGAPNGWFTATFDRPGEWSFKATSVAADESLSSRPLALRLYRSPTVARVTDPAGLQEVAADLGGVRPLFPGAAVTAWISELADVPVTPGRYYWSFEEGSSGPTWFGLGSSFVGTGPPDETPPELDLSTPSDGSSYAPSAVPATVVYSCTDTEGPAEAVVTVDGVATDQLATTNGPHTVEVVCTDQAGNTATATATYTVIEVRPVVTVSGPVAATIDAVTTLVVTATHPGGPDPVPAGFEFSLSGEFTTEVLGATVVPAGISCSEVLGVGTCQSSSALAVGQSVSVSFTLRAPSIAGRVLSACQPLNGAGQRIGNPDYRGPVCLNAIAYPGPADNGNPINRATPSGDATMVSIPLDGPYVRFTASATDAPTGSPVTLTLTPRNAGTGTRTGIGFSVARSPVGGWQPDPTLLPPGWVCSEPGQVTCAAPNLTLGPGEEGPPVRLVFVAPPAPSPEPTSACQAVAYLFDLPSPLPSPCGLFLLYWDGVVPNGTPQGQTTSSILTEAVVYRIGEPTGIPGPCVLVDTPDVDFGDVRVGTEAEAPVAVRSCSTSANTLAVSVSDATPSDGGTPATWTASTATTVPANAFRWSVRPPGGSFLTVASTPVVPVGSTLAAGATRTDLHRLLLGPNGPGLGRPFRSTITYTATSP